MIKELAVLTQRLVDKAFLKKEILNAESDRTEAMYPGGSGWRFDAQVFALDSDLDYEAKDKYIREKLAPANSKLDKLQDKRDFRLAVLESIPLIGVVTGLIAIGLNFI